MKILLTVDPEIPVPPINYGGIERIVDALITAYKQLGHEVFLVANPDSGNPHVKKLYGWPRLHSNGGRNILRNAFFLYKTIRQAKPDVIHSFSRLLYQYPTFALTDIPVIQSYQRAISSNSTRLASVLAGRQLSYTSCGAHMLSNHPIANKCIAIHNFTDTNFFKEDISFSKEYLMFLGRIEDIKGTKEAIEVAIKTNEKLIIAGNIQPGHDEYFNAHIKQHLDNPLIQYVGPVNDEQKRDYLQKAKALLFPIKWAEPFGIVMAEAMACGTPVIGFNCGSVPEVVKDGKTGFIVSDIEHMVEAVRRIDEIDRDLVRQDCQQRFSLKKITTDYINLYQKQLAVK